MSENGVERSGPSDGPDPWCTWCDFEPPDGELPYRIKGEDDGRWPPAFCSLQCAARWGNAAHQDRIYHVEHGRGVRCDGGDDHGVAADTLYCQNLAEHDQEVEMVSGPYDGVRCPECGRMAGGGDPLDIPYVDDTPSTDIEKRGEPMPTNAYCDRHRETVGDDSPRGDKYNDDRTVFALVYDGLSLRAQLYDEREVERYREETHLDVSLTPAGECRIEGVCKTDPREATEGSSREQ